MTTVPSAFVDVRHLTVAYRSSHSLLKRLAGHSASEHVVLEDISFQLTAGDQVVLYGPPGAGKSTLLRVLAGTDLTHEGRVTVNNHVPAENPRSAAGYVSSEEFEPHTDTVEEVLTMYAHTHDIAHSATKLRQITDTLALTGVLNRPAEELSTTERLRINLARAALATPPLLLLDDIVEQLGTSSIKQLLQTQFHHQTMIIATRSAHIAEALDLPLLILHNGALVQQGTRDDIAAAVTCPRILNVWVEGLRYDIFRQLKRHPGVLSIHLLPTTQFSGQKLRITVRSSQHLPSLYDAISQAPLIRVEEIPPSLHDILTRISA